MFRFLNRFLSKKNFPMLLLFDVDGTLTLPRLPINPSMQKFLLETVLKKTEIALVGGSDFNKISEQMGGDKGKCYKENFTVQSLFKVISQFSYVFSENGLVAHKNGKEFSRQSIQEHVGEIKLQKFINYALRYMSELELPVKRGTFIEFRSGLINVCPVGRSCSQAERNQFEQYDKEHKIREKFVAALREKFPDLGLIYAIGGQISFDVYPIGWDKRYCLKHLKDYEDIHFFGDKTEPGGNDYEIFTDPRVIGHRVSSPDDTRRQLEKFLGLN